jgi:aminoglycoside 3-N-acetyltransferase I
LDLPVTSSAYTIIRLDRDDIDLMRGMLECFGEAFGERDTYCAAQPDDRYLRDLLSGDSFVAIVALWEGEVIGGLTAYELRKFERERSEFYIYDLAVQEGHRRRGVASALIGALKPIAKARGASVIFVQADLDDEPAIELYRTLGTREDVVHFDIAVD